MPMENRVQKGSITVFLSLLLVLLISVVTASLESAHLAAVRSQISIGSEAAMYSLFSHFEKSLYEDYELLFINDRLDFNGILQAEMKSYEDPAEGIVQGSNHLRFIMESVQVNNKVYLTDNSGEAFLKEINQILAADAIALVKQSITGYVKQLSQSGTVTEYMNEIMEQSMPLPDMMKQMEQAAEKSESVESGIAELTKSAGSCTETAAEFREVLKKLKADVSVAGEHSESEKKLKQSLRILADNKRKLEEQLEKVLEDLEEYEKSAEKINGNMEEVRKGLQEEELEESYKETLYEELKSVLDVTSESGSWYQQFSAAKEDVKRNLHLLQSTYIPSSEDISSDAVLDGTVEKNLKQAVDVLNECKTVDIPVGESAVENKYSISARSLIDTVKKLITEGVFSIIVDNQQDLSKRTIDMADMPSQSQRKERTDSGKNLFETAVDNTRDTLALNIYLAEYMDCYIDSKYYDLEYVLGGERSDVENLKSTVNQLLLLRQAMNLMYLLTDSAKRNQAQTAAAAMLAVTGNGVLIQGMSMIILTAWAYAEAVGDVKALVNQKKVAFIKTSDSWKLSLEQAADYRNWEAAGKTEGRAGLNYQEYLRILLFFHSRVNNMFRGLDMIQWDICQDDPDFRIDQCVYAMDADFSLCVKPIFLSYQNLAWGKSGYVFEHKEQEAYA